MLDTGVGVVGSTGGRLVGLVWLGLGELTQCEGLVWQSELLSARKRDRRAVRGRVDVGVGAVVAMGVMVVVRRRRG